VFSGSSEDDGVILICYDGSADSVAAIDRVAELMPGAQATVLTIWEPFVDAMVRSGSLGMGFGWTSPSADDGKVDEASQAAAVKNAAEGALRASTAGLLAQPRNASRHGGIGDVILGVAADVDAELVVLGTRGLGGMKSFLLGSVSHAVVQQADRAVLVVPSPGLAERRHRLAHRAEVEAGVT
jgi:nucleotide-binding universal stress UspA family protein